MIPRFALLTPAASLAVALALGAIGVWLFFKDTAALENERRRRDDRTRIELQLAESQRRIEQLQVEATPARERALESAKTIQQLRQLTSTWQWFGGNREQQRANQARLKDMEAHHAEIVAKANVLQQELRRAEWEHDNREIELGRIDAPLREGGKGKAAAASSLRWAWLRARSWILLGAAAGAFCGGIAPAIWRWSRRWRRGALAAPPAAAK
jgi:hypothetical protein